MKIAVNITKFVLLIAFIAGVYIIAYSEAVKANDVYNEAVENQNALLKGRIALLEARILLLEADLAISDQQIELLEKQLVRIRF